MNENSVTPMIGTSERPVASAAPTRKRPRRLLLFGALFLLSNSNLRPIASGDTVAAGLVPVSLAVDHTITLDRFAPWVDANAPNLSYSMQSHRGATYSAYPIAGPLLIAPAYLPLAAIPGIRRLDTEELFLLASFLEKIAASLLAAGSVLVMLALLQRLTTRRWALILTLVYALATSIWATASQALWQHTFGVLALALSLFFLKEAEEQPRALWWCGIAAGVALAVRPTNIVLLPALLAALWSMGSRPAGYVRVVVPMLIAGSAVSAYNLWVFGRLSGGYPPHLYGAWLGGLAGVLVSPGRGLLVYTPVVAMALVAALPAAAAQRARDRALVVASTVFIVLHAMVIAKWGMWWGGYCWGPRLLTEIVPFALVLMAVGARAFERSRALRVSLVVLVAWSCATQVVGTYYYPKGAWDSRPGSVDTYPDRLWDWQDNPIGRAVAAGIYRTPYIFAAKILGAGSS